MLVWRKINRVYIKFRFSRRRWLRLRYSYCEGMCDRDPHRSAVLTRTLAKFVSVSRTIEENLLSHSILQRSEQNCKEICELAMQTKDAHLLISNACRHTLRTYVKQTTRCPLPRRHIDSILREESGYVHVCESLFNILKMTLSFFLKENLAS